MDPLTILLYCQVMRIVLRNTALVHIVLYCQEPNILAIRQYIPYIARDGFYSAAATILWCLEYLVSQTMTSNTLTLQLHHSPSDFADP